MKTGPNVSSEVCKTCRFEKKCGYKHNESLDLSSLIYDESVGCEKLQLKEPSEIEMEEIEDAKNQATILQ